MGCVGKAAFVATGRLRLSSSGARRCQFGVRWKRPPRAAECDRGWGALTCGVATSGCVGECRLALPQGSRGSGSSDARARGLRRNYSNIWRPTGNEKRASTNTAVPSTSDMGKVWTEEVPVYVGEGWVSVAFWSPTLPIPGTAAGESSLLSSERAGDCRLSRHRATEAMPLPP